MGHLVDKRQRREEFSEAVVETRPKCPHIVAQQKEEPRSEPLRFCEAGKVIEEAKALVSHDVITYGAQSAWESGSPQRKKPTRLPTHARRPEEVVEWQRSEDQETHVVRQHVERRQRPHAAKRAKTKMRGPTIAKTIRERGCARTMVANERHVSLSSGLPAFLNVCSACCSTAADD